MAENVLTTPAEALPKDISYEQFLNWEGPSEHVEWVAGAVIPMSPVTAEHSLIAVWLTSLMHTFASHHGIGQVFSEPFQMKTAPNLPGRSPDISFLTNGNSSRKKRLYIEGPADLVVEVV